MGDSRSSYWDVEPIAPRDVGLHSAELSGSFYAGSYEWRSPGGTGATHATCTRDSRANRGAESVHAGDAGSCLPRQPAVASGGCTPAALQSPRGHPGCRCAPGSLGLWRSGLGTPARSHSAAPRRAQDGEDHIRAKLRGKHPRLRAPCASCGTPRGGRRRIQDTRASGAGGPRPSSLHFRFSQGLSAGRVTPLRDPRANHRPSPPGRYAAQRGPAAEGREQHGETLRAH